MVHQVPVQFPKKCACGRTVASWTEWAKLPDKGFQVDEYESLNLRDCQCGSTLAVVICIHKLEDPAAQAYAEEIAAQVEANERAEAEHECAYLFCHDGGED